MSSSIKELSDKVFAGLGPFTITITDPTEARILAWAIVSHFCQYDQRCTQNAMQMLIISCEEVGVDDGVSVWYESGNITAKAHGRSCLPTWVKPMMTHIMTHITKKIQEIE